MLRVGVLRLAGIAIVCAGLLTSAYQAFSHQLYRSPHVDDVRETDRLTERRISPNLPMGLPVHIRIFKAESKLELWMKTAAGWQLQGDYDVCSWSGHLGPKLKEGDRQSPEGFYLVGKRSLNPNSSYHLSFNLGFPNRFDRAHGRTGSFLMVHGDCVSIGCYAMTDKGIEEIYRRVEAALNRGQRHVRVHVFPFRMTYANMKKHAASKWIGFWRQLKPAYDHFEKHGAPARTTVSGKTYVVHGAS